MKQKIWQVNFKFSVSPEQYAEAVAPLADPISEVGGLLWKVWVINPHEHEAGGIHLFADQEALDAYAGSDIVDGILNHPALSDFSVKTFDVMTPYSLKTRAPLDESVAA